MHKRQNNRSRVRAVLLASVAAGVMATAPMPAHALLGGIGKAIGGLFGGGSGGGGSACSGDLGGAFRSAVNGIQSAASGNLGGVSKTLGVADKFAGCPVVESIPGAVEIQTIKTAVEAVIQTREALQQTIHQANMLAHGRLSVVGWILDRWEEFVALLGGDSQGIGWEEPVVVRDFEEAYPETPVFTSPEDLLILREQQDKLGRDASVDSKRVSAKLAQDIEALSGQLEALEAERTQCSGQTCVGDMNFQIGVVSAQLQAKTALMQAAHNRVSESQIDAHREARKAADAEWNRMIQDVGSN